MNKLNRKVEYALMALKYMSEKFAGHITTVKEICAATHIPFDATSRVMQQMAQKKVLKSEQGARGGYLLVTDLSKISFHEILEIIDGPMQIVRCASGKKTCEFLAKCNMTSPLQNLNHRLVDFYKELSVAEVLNSRETPRLSVSSQATGGK